VGAPAISSVSRAGTEVPVGLHGSEEKRHPRALEPGVLVMNVLIRILAGKVYGQASETPLMILGAGCIAGDALWGFGTSAAHAKWKF